MLLRSDFQSNEYDDASTKMCQPKCVNYRKSGYSRGVSFFADALFREKHNSEI